MGQGTGRVWPGLAGSGSGLAGSGRVWVGSGRIGSDMGRVWKIGKIEKIAKIEGSGRDQKKWKICKKMTPSPWEKVTPGPRPGRKKCCESLFAIFEKCDFGHDWQNSDHF